MANVFSERTLREFEAAAASIPLRPLDRAFSTAKVRLGTDPGGPAGARKAQFRRYVAGIDQRDPKQRDRLGAALGALIAEVATSKQAFLVQAAELDGFVFVDGVFRPADASSIDDRARQLRLLANDRPAEAVAGAKELVDAIWRSAGPALAKNDPVRTSLQQLVVVVSDLSELNDVTSRHARLAVGAALAFADYFSAVR